MCPFDDDQSFDELRSQGRTLWYEHQRLVAELAALSAQEQSEAAELKARIEESARLLAQIQAMQGERDALQKRVAELEAKLEAKGQKGNKKNKSERRKRTCSNPACADKTCPIHHKPEPAKQKGHAPREQLALPVEEKVYELPEAERVCDKCQGVLKQWAGQDEITEQIEVHVRGYVRRKNIQRKYVCVCGACIKTAPAPLKLIPGGRYTVGFGVEVAYDKYCDHLPLERQVRTMRNQGLDIDSQTLWDQIDYLAFLLPDTYRLIRSYIFGHDVIGADETTWKLMPQTGGSKTWYIWLCQVNDAVWYTLQPTRSADAGKVLFNLKDKKQSLPDALLPAYQGTVMVDGYVAYKTLSAAYPTLVLAHCWSHARREGLDAEQAFPEPSVELIQLIDELFVIDARAPKGPRGDAERAKLRTSESAKVLTKIEAWVWKYAKSTPPGSALTKAALYLANQWEGLIRFLDDPRIPLENNGSERGARTPVVGRKNHYGSRSERGTMVAAILYTLVETARRSGMEPKAYLHLSALRNLRGLGAVLPKEVTEAMLVEQLEMTAEQAARALRWKPDEDSPTGAAVIASDTGAVAADQKISSE